MIDKILYMIFRNLEHVLSKYMESFPDAVIDFFDCVHNFFVTLLILNSIHYGCVFLCSFSLVLSRSVSRKIFRRRILDKSKSF
ncbi:hypothetical protein TSH100_31095 [Azospirillum sp. TSH100]|nr:hypothetical protein TSH100_31095 [Azospirillum sp. TSH100]